MVSRAGWLHAKLVLVLAMSVLHGLLSRWVKRFRRRPQPRIAEILSYCQ